MLFWLVVVLLIAATIVGMLIGLDRRQQIKIWLVWGILGGGIVVEQALIATFVDPTVLSQDDIFEDYIRRNTTLGIETAPTGLESTNCELFSTHFIYSYALCSFGMGVESDGLRHYTLELLMPAGYLEFGVNNHPRRILWDSPTVYKFNENGEIEIDFRIRSRIDR